MGRRRKPNVFVFDEAPDLRQDTLTSLMRLTATDGEDNLSVLLAEEPGCTGTCAARR